MAEAIAATWRTLTAMPEYDVIVAGLGAMGSAAAAELSARGFRVSGIDRFHPPHPFGSSHGETRIIREAYFEHPLYVPLVQRAYERWQALEERTGERLLVRTGGLMIGPADGELVAGARASAERHGLGHDVLTAREVEARYPALKLEKDWVAVREPRAGALLPERCIAAHLRQAAAAGATLRTGARMTGWEAGPHGVEVWGDDWRARAARLVLATGAWLGEDSRIRLPLTVERNVVHWFQPKANASAFRAGALPIYLIEYELGRMIYGFPGIDEAGPGVKVALHHQGVETSADTVDRTVSREEVEDMRALMRTYLPDLDGAHLRSSACIYTNMPDSHFVLDWHPDSDRVLVVSACSGHGFKFAAAMGELIGDLIEERITRYELGAFKYRLG